MLAILATRCPKWTKKITSDRLASLATGDGLCNYSVSQGFEELPLLRSLL